MNGGRIINGEYTKMYYMSKLTDSEADMLNMFKCVDVNKGNSIARWTGVLFLIHRGQALSVPAMAIRRQDLHGCQRRRSSARRSREVVRQQSARTEDRRRMEGCRQVVPVAGGIEIGRRDD